MRTLYFDCFAGISGDMALGALVDLGADRDALLAALNTLPVEGFRLSFEQANKNGIEATRAIVATDEDHHHRGLSKIIGIIDGSGISDNARQLAKRIFTRLGETEAEIHGVGVEEIHFHEVGALDAIVDIVGAAVAVDLIGAESIISSPVRTGFGTVRCAHGDYPIPAPATALLLRDVPIYAGELEGEWSTPTGAAILTTICSGFGNMPAMRVKRIGYGAGNRSVESMPNLLRVFLGETEDSEPSEVVVIEAEIDDMNPQLFGHLHDLLPAAGALDWYLTPVQMKKNRPGSLLTVICKPASRPAVAELIFRETTTIGYRYYRAAREELEREVVKVDTPLGEIGFKVARRGGGIVNVMPEFDDLRRTAAVSGRPLKEVREIAMRAFMERNESD
ncbi:MAG TPA: nickel pincer cofactor biosynthesis protein LarC [Acidobacteriota bacterium]|nr:nickel pincer cofactor biosynthesis protein LarC [Acidobacteriota bacterium]